MSRLSALIDSFLKHCYSQIIFSRLKAERDLSFEHEDPRIVKSKRMHRTYSYHSNAPFFFAKKKKNSPKLLTFDCFVPPNLKTLFARHANFLYEIALIEFYDFFLICRLTLPYHKSFQRLKKIGSL